MKQKLRKTINIGKFKIGGNNPTFIIAEAGVNHNGELKYAKKLIDVAIDANADAVKFQTYNVDRIVSKWSSPDSYKMLKKYELTEDEFAEISDYSKQHGIIFCSTPFDKTSSDMLEKLNVPLYKTSSGDLDNIPLLTHISKKKKPVFISTGMSNMSEIKEAIDSTSSFNDQIALLHCTSIYPPYYNEVNLRVIHTLAKEFNVLVGYSDHTLGYEVSIGAVCFGAKIIEKHLTLDNKMHGPDHKASLEPDKFKEMVRAIRNIEKALGTHNKKVLPREKNIRKLARRSIIAIQDIPRNKKIKMEDIDILRPTGGIAPKYLYKVLGRNTNIYIKKGTKLKWSLLN